MKKIVFYFDNKATRIFVEKVNDEGEKKMVLSSPYNFVSRSEIVARVIDVDDDEQIPSRLDPGHKYYNIEKYVSVKVDEGVYYDEIEKAYKSSEFGFITYNNGKLRLISTLIVARDKVKAYYTVFPTKFGKIPTYDDIYEYLHDYKILAGIERGKVDAQLKKIDIKKPKVMRVLVAHGKEPVNGHEEYYIPIIDIERKAGEILADGSIDFKEVGSIIQVKKNQQVLKKIPQVKPVDGYNIYGDKVTAEIEEIRGYKRGENIVESGDDENIFVSSLDGCVDADKKTVSVLPIAVIRGDVNYESGNIDFNGSVHVFGSVLPGFSVKATSDIIIDNNVDDALIEAGGNITVKMGVVGKESVRIKAGGKVVAQFLLNANVEAAGEVIVEDSIINCDVFSNNMVRVDAKSGKIIGGKTTALYEIVAKVAGAPNGTGTLLNVGRNLFIEKELVEIREEISQSTEGVSEIMRELKVGFGEEVFKNPKSYISILPPARRKKCLILLKKLSDGNKTVKELTEKCKEIEAKLEFDREPVIIIKGKAHPGTVLNIKKSVRKIENQTENARFYEDPEDRIIRFTSAV